MSWRFGPGGSRRDKEDLEDIEEQFNELDEAMAEFEEFFSAEDASLDAEGGGSTPEDGFGGVDIHDETELGYCPMCGSELEHEDDFSASCPRCGPIAVQAWKMYAPEETPDEDDEGVNIDID